MAGVSSAGVGNHSAGVGNSSAGVGNSSAGVGNSSAGVGIISAGVEVLHKRSISIPIPHKVLHLLSTFQKWVARMLRICIA